MHLTEAICRPKSIFKSRNEGNLPPKVDLLKQEILTLDDLKHISLGGWGKGVGWVFGEGRGGGC